MDVNKPVNKTDQPKVAFQEPKVTSPSYPSPPPPPPTTSTPPPETPKQSGFPKFDKKKALIALAVVFVLIGATVGIFKLSKIPEIFVGEDVYDCRTDPNVCTGDECCGGGTGICRDECYLSGDGYICCNGSWSSSCAGCGTQPSPSLPPFPSEIPSTCSQCSDLSLNPDPGCAADPNCTSPGQDGFCCTIGGANFCCYTNCECYTGSQFGCHDAGNGCITMDEAVTDWKVKVCDCTDNPQCPCSSNCHWETHSWAAGETKCILGSNECGQVDVLGFCGSCKDTGCGGSESPPPSQSPSPPPSQSPSPSPSPPPSQSPSPTPSSSPPVQNLVCNQLTGLTHGEPISTTVNLGDNVVFACTHVAEPPSLFDHYNYRFSIDGVNWISPTDWLYITGSTPPLEITQSGDYIVQCQACSLEGSSPEVCSDWGAAGGWTQDTIN
ncbi:hypothetical protein ACFLZ1_03425 [Patescibacteria group bacterium]